MNRAGVMQMSTGMVKGVARVNLLYKMVINVCNTFLERKHFQESKNIICQQFHGSLIRAGIMQLKRVLLLLYN